MATDFKTALERELSHIKTQNGLSDDKAFLIWFLTAILEIDEDAALEAISVEGANDNGIDFFHVDDEEGRVFIGQGKFSAGLDHKVKEKDVATLESSLNWLANPEARDGTANLTWRSLLRIFSKLKRTATALNWGWMWPRDVWVALCGNYRRACGGGFPEIAKWWAVVVQVSPADGKIMLGKMISE